MSLVVMDLRARAIENGQRDFYAIFLGLELTSKVCCD